MVQILEGCWTVGWMAKGVPGWPLRRGMIDLVVLNWLGSGAVHGDLSSIGGLGPAWACFRPLGG